MKWKIGNVKIDNQVVLAPMAGICDSAYRRIIKSMGCGLVETEMIANNAIKYGNKKVNELLFMTEYERPIAQQIYGSEIDSFKIASEYITENVSPDLIDINMGCPVNKVAVDAKAGCALLREPSKAFDIVKTTVDTTDIPVMVKIRSGWDKNNINAMEISKLMEKAGASAITIHPRTRVQGYSGKADWTLIKQIKEELSIPVIGNGDVWTCYDAEKMINETQCDAVMIGRGVLGNPWLIRDCVNYLEQGKEPETVTNQERVEMLKKHAALLVELKTEEKAMRQIRKHASYYVKSIPGNGRIKEKIYHTKTKEELFELLDTFVNDS